VEDAEKTAARARRRLHGFIIHLMIYFAVMTVMLPVNFILAPDNLWSLFPLIGWGAPLALHAAWAMGLLDVLRK
jgi:hypothetical protein